MGPSPLPNPWVVARPCSGRSPKSNKCRAHFNRPAQTKSVMPNNGAAPPARPASRNLSNMQNSAEPSFRNDITRPCASVWPSRSLATRCRTGSFKSPFSSDQPMVSISVKESNTVRTHPFLISIDRTKPAACNASIIALHFCRFSRFSSRERLSSVGRCHMIRVCVPGYSKSFFASRKIFLTVSGARVPTARIPVASRKPMAWNSKSFTCDSPSSSVWSIFSLCVVFSCLYFIAKSSGKGLLMTIFRSPPCSLIRGHRSKASGVAYGRRNVSVPLIVFLALQWVIRRQWGFLSCLVLGFRLCHHLAQFGLLRHRNALAAALAQGFVCLGGRCVLPRGVLGAQRENLRQCGQRSLFRHALRRREPVFV